jgi:hypothetical protein
MHVIKLTKDEVTLLSAALHKAANTCAKENAEAPGNATVFAVDILALRKNINEQATKR